MKKTVYNFNLDLDWNLLKNISQIDRFDASWSSIEKTEGDSLKQLKNIATIQSVGASTRIEGSKMSDVEVERLLNNIDISKIVDRDEQEVLGYFSVHDLMTTSFEEIVVTESNIKNLHNQLLKHSEKDTWHKGNYKQHSNAVEASFPDGSKQIIFKTTPPGYATEEAMRALVEWYYAEKEVHPLVIAATFAYDFVSIHPFQDGNGRLSRLLTTLLLMKYGYQWIQYVSFEHEIENNKKEYYRSLQTCQAQRPNENISVWINFFLDSLINVQKKLVQKLEFKETQDQLTSREKAIYIFIRSSPGCKSGEISRRLKISSSSVKRSLAVLIANNLVEKRGKGAGTNYAVL